MHLFGVDIGIGIGAGIAYARLMFILSGAPTELSISSEVKK